MMVCTLAVFATPSGVYSQQPMLMAEVDIAAMDSAGHHLHFDIDSPSDDGEYSLLMPAALLFPTRLHDPIN